MEDIKIWLYLGFGLIYFIVRQMRKKKADAEPNVEGEQETQSPQRKPLSFEDLLREFTEEKEVVAKEVLIDEYAEEQKQQEKIEALKQVAKEDHTKRRFADEESMKVYANSIKQAEGSDLKFEKDPQFELKSKNKATEQETENNFLKEILESFNDPHQAKKAVIISEILNKRY
ncbi:MAG: hypothetical protein ACJA08_001679 [Cyclobacteriaceae bacterium]|jgi:hypothetical protein